ncbi:acetylserotonin O-methyltransferase-like [Rhinophrynus dorsalis]
MKRKEDVISAFDLSPFRSICDLGGCTGTMAKDLSSLYPETRFIVFDLPKVVQTVEKYFYPQNQHICFQQGDFFKDPLPEADLYFLTRVIYNWSDDKCLQLLKKVYNICKPGGGVFIAEDILNEDGHGPVLSQLADLILLISTEGKARTPSKHKSLLNAAGFKDIQFNNILIYSPDLETHRDHVSEVLQKLRENKLYCKLENYEFHRSSVSFLGYVISKEGFAMDKNKLAALQQ